MHNRVNKSNQVRKLTISFLQFGTLKKNVSVLQTKKVIGALLKTIVNCLKFRTYKKKKRAINRKIEINQNGRKKKLSQKISVD